LIPTRYTYAVAVDFYTALPALQRLEEATSAGAASLPDDWWLLATDVVGSTAHAAAGRYKNVNLVSAAGITACLNALQRREIPFFFGGDGALLACPDADGPTLTGVLLGMRDLARKAYGFDLRVGAYRADDLRAGGFTVQLARLQATPLLSQALFLGTGIPETDRRLKTGDPGRAAGITPTDPDLTGLKCQWNEIPSASGEMLTLLVLPATESVLQEVLQQVRDICGSEVQRHPLNPVTMRLALRPSQHAAGLALTHHRLPRWQRTLVAARESLLMSVGEFFLRRTGAVWSGVDWGAYFGSFRRFSDSEKLCGFLSMVVACSADQRREVLARLDAQEGRGALVYGFHSSPSAMVTCMVFDHRFHHYHFIDGSGGGYTLASKVLKEKQSRRIPADVPPLADGGPPK
jgi:hypothetical protein